MATLSDVESGTGEYKYIRLQDSINCYPIGTAHRESASNEGILEKIESLIKTDRISVDAGLCMVSAISVVFDGGASSLGMNEINPQAREITGKVARQQTSKEVTAYS